MRRGTRVYRVGKNRQGWYVAHRRWWGSYSVMEGLPSMDAALQVLHSHAWRPGLWS